MFDFSTKAAPHEENCMPLLRSSKASTISLCYKHFTPSGVADSVDDCGSVASICDPRVKNATLAEIVQWVWEKYYSHHDEQAAVATTVLNNNMSD